jgi:hypothetical protein
MNKGIYSLNQMMKKTFKGFFQVFLEDQERGTKIDTLCIFYL